MFIKYITIYQLNSLIYYITVKVFMANLKKRINEPVHNALTEFITNAMIIQVERTQELRCNLLLYTLILYNTLLKLKRLEQWQRKEFSKCTFSFISIQL